MRTRAEAEATKKIVPEAEDFLPINSIDYVEFYVGNAKQAAYYYIQAWGFEGIAYSGLETGNKEYASYVLRQGNVTFVFTSPYHEGGPINEFINKHGDGVKVIALNVDDATYSFNETVKRGAKSYMQPKRLKDENGEVVLSGIHTYGDVVHIFVERKNYGGAFLPGYQKWEAPIKGKSVGFIEIDHIVGNVDWGQMNVWAEFYERVMGFGRLISFDDKDISTEYTALMSKVMSDGRGRIKFPINEPAHGKKRSQIEEYIIFNHGPGVQHIALLTNDIISTISELRKRGIEFLYVPETYYDEVPARVGKIDEPLDVIKNLQILVDRDEEGYLLQLFSKPVQDRPTLFYEIIQRKGAKSFGKGNFKALFEAIEREQRLRGTLDY